MILHSSAGNRDNKKGLIYLGIDSLVKDRLYKIQFNIGNENISQDFYFGDFNIILTEISDQYNIISNGEILEKDKLNLEASFKRLLFVKDIELEGITSLKAYWDRSRVFFVNELFSFFKVFLKENLRQTNHFDGFIKSYISSIDSSKQYYSSYIPKELKQQNTKIPLVIISPFTYYPIPYLKTWGNSNLEQIMWDSKLAEEYGFGIIWINLREHPGLNEIAMTAFQEILNDVKSNHNIDEDRVFIFGNSSSSRKALSLVTRFPTIVAACVLYNPDVEMNYRYQFQNLSNLGLYMQHSIKDEVVPMKNVELLYEKMEPYFKNPTFKIVDDNTHYIAAKDSYRNAFEYIKDKKRNYKPEKIILSISELKYGESYGLRLLEKQKDGRATIEVFFNDDTIQIKSQNVNHFELDLGGRNSEAPIKLNGSLLKKIFKEELKLDVLIGSKDDSFTFIKNNSVEGPINHAFANKFKIVFNKKDESIKDTLNELWKKVYFNDALFSRDINITAKDMCNSNVILIGAKFDNELIQGMVDQLPIKIHEDYILFRNRRYVGQNVFISFVYPNPINPDKYVVLIASNGKLKSIPIKDFSNDGKTDFMVFNYIGGRYELSSSGNFDNNWQ